MDSTAALQKLGEASKTISQLIGATTFSQSDADQRILKRLFQARDTVNWTAQQMIGAELSIALADYQQVCNAIDDAATRLSGIQSAVSKAELVLSAVDEVVAAASSLVKLLPA